MKQQTVDYVKDICKSKLSEDNNMARAQLMLKNMNFFRDYNNASGFSGNIPFKVLEECLKSMVKKYDVMAGSVTSITDISGDVTWNGGMCERGKQSKEGWMFTVHADDLYEYMVKLVLMSFIRIKELKIKKRDTEAVLDRMRRI